MSNTDAFWGHKPRRIGPALVVAALAVTGAFFVVPGSGISSTLTPSQVVLPTSPSSSSDSSGSDQGASSDQGSNAGSSNSEMAATAGNVGDLATGVVLIDTTLPGGSAAGTGMVLTADGQVLTNYHVVAESTEISVTIATTGQTYSATLVGHDATHDVALLQLQGASGLQTVTVDNDQESSGQVTAVGNAGGQGFLTESTGQITDTNSTITVADETTSSGRTMTDLIETTAQAVPGDSGGPMYDNENEVVGITTAGTSQGQGSRRGGGQGVTTASYAVSIDTALGIVDQIRSGQESGTVEIGPGAYLGVVVAEDGSLAQVVPDSAAAQAGLVEGDVITAIGDERVNAVSDISSALENLNPGDQITLTWQTATGQTEQASTVLGESPVN